MYADISWDSNTPLEKMRPLRSGWAVFISWANLSLLLPISRKETAGRSCRRDGINDRRSFSTEASPMPKCPTSWSAALYCLRTAATCSELGSWSRLLGTGSQPMGARVPRRYFFQLSPAIQIFEAACFNNITITRCAAAAMLAFQVPPNDSQTSWNMICTWSRFTLARIQSHRQKNTFTDR